MSKRKITDAEVNAAIVKVRRNIHDPDALRVFFEKIPLGVGQLILDNLPVVDLITVLRIPKIALASKFKSFIDPDFWKRKFINLYGDDIYNRFVNHFVNDLSTLNDRQFLFAYAAADRFVMEINSSEPLLHPSEYDLTGTTIGFARIVMENTQENEVHIEYDYELDRREITVMFDDASADDVYFLSGSMIDYGRSDDDIGRGGGTNAVYISDDVDTRRFIVGRIVAILIQLGYKSHVIPPDTRGDKPQYEYNLFLSCNICNSEATVKCCSKGLYCGESCRDIDWGTHQINH